MKILFIDNFDSFTYNLVDEFRRLGAQVSVYRNHLSENEVDFVLKKERPDLITLGPGPSSPAEAGICLDLLRTQYRNFPFFGVCLGHQCMVEAFGGRVDLCRQVYHGKPSMIEHDGQGIFQDLPKPLQVGRYHSLAAVHIPEMLKITARYEDIVMAIEHRDFPLFGVQFHPESILTPYGRAIIRNVLTMADSNITGSGNRI